MHVTGRSSLQVGWDDRGKGTLTVRQSKAEEDKTAGAANIVFTMESGKVIVNGAVYKGLRAQKARCSPTLCCSLVFWLQCPSAMRSLTGQDTELCVEPASGLNRTRQLLMLRSPNSAFPVLHAEREPGAHLEPLG